MLINTIEELRLYFPAHAMDEIDGMAGFLDNSEHDFLIDKIGSKLYDSLSEYYQTINPQGVVEAVRLGEKQSYMMQLLLCCQRCIVFDAFSRAISVHAVSINNVGVNVATADDYGKADKDSITAFKQTCVKEAHAAVNRLLLELENWTRADAALAVDAELTADETERREIVRKWKSSRYYFLAASLLIPSAQVLQEYLNIYDSREKFIQMLPALRNIQEEIVEPLLGDTMTEYIVDVAIKGTQDKVLAHIIHGLRKVMAACLEEHTTVLTIPAERRHAAHDEAERQLKRVSEYITCNLDSLPKEIVKGSPFDMKIKTICGQPVFENNKAGNVIFVIPALN